MKNGSARIIFDAFNQRIKILSFKGDLGDLMNQLTVYKSKATIGKIFSIIPKEDIDMYKDHGFIIEAKLDQFLNGQPAYFLSKFLTSKRKMSMHLPEEEEVLIRSREYISEEYIHPTYEQFTIRDVKKADADELAKLYDGVFETYPSPLNNSDYIKFAMDHNVYFKVALYENKIVSAASADMNPINLNAEITDCATSTLHIGNGLIGRLIFELEKDLRQMKYKVLFSTARAISTGMNIVFAKHDYVYGGRLTTHCHICGQFENMNIWYKLL
ncbi:putative beta-lysine N-acetyltransferase [Clostridium vincentii]